MDEHSAEAIVRHPWWVPTSEIASLIARVQPFTMVADASLTDLANQIRFVLASGMPGSLVECGVWKGGASFLMASLLKRVGDQTRKVWMFDSFEGLPPPGDIDGVAAKAWAIGCDGPYRYNGRVPVEDVRETAQQLGLESQVTLVKGWFDQSLRLHRDRVGPIAVLRVDADWYSSVTSCLEGLFDQVVEGGFVVLDDYYTWDGCIIATHEFLAGRHLPLKIESPVGARLGMPAVLRKGDSTWADVWSRVVAAERRHASVNELLAAVPTGQGCLYVGDDPTSAESLPHRRLIPFLERDGEYWGPPEDDATAVRELERLRETGVGFIVFEESAFWWLNYYSGFHHHLRSRYRVALNNDRLVLFDLRSPA